MKKLLSFFILCLIITACGSPSASKSQSDTTRFLVSLPKSVWQDSFPNLAGQVNIFTMDQDGSDLRLLVPPFDNYNFVLDKSPDGQQLLISSSPSVSDSITIGSLYVLTLHDLTAVQLTNNNYFISNSRLMFMPGAIWLGNRNQIAFIESISVEGVPKIFVINPDGSGLKQINTSYNPENLTLPLFFTGFNDQGDIYWRSGHLANEGEGLFADNSMHISNIDTGTLEFIASPDTDGFPYISFAPVGNKAITDGWLRDWDLNILAVHNQKQVEDFGAAFWSPDGDTVLITNICPVFTNCEITNSKSSFLVSDSDLIMKETFLIENSGLIYDAQWHPNQNKVLLTVIEDHGGTAELSPQVLSLDTMKIERPMENLKIGYGGFGYVGFRLFWYQEQLSGDEY